MRAFHAPGGLGEILARTSFLEPLVVGRRVLELGSAGATAGASARALAQRGAASVLAADEDAAGVERASASSPHPAVAWRTLAPGAMPDGPFDLVLVHDGAPLAAAPDRVARLAALLAPGGQLVAALPVAGAPLLGALAGDPGPREAPAYESFVGSLQSVFPVVEIATQSAALGWVLAAASDPEPELAVDGAHGEPPQAAAYLAICGSAPAGLAGMVLVTLPAAAALRDAAARAAIESGAVEIEIAGARAEAVAMAGWLEQADRRVAEALEDRAKLREALAAAGERAAEADRTAGSLRARIAELEAALAAAREAEAERARERDEAQREAQVRAREARAWADAQGRIEQRLAELEAFSTSQGRDVEVAHVEVARAIADGAVARSCADEARFEADDASRRAELAESELRRLGEDLAAGRREAERLRAEAGRLRDELEAARGRAAERAEG
jgi:hypothetical protein